MAAIFSQATKWICIWTSLFSVFWKKVAHGLCPFLASVYLLVFQHFIGRTLVWSPQSSRQKPPLDTFLMTNVRWIESFSALIFTLIDACKHISSASDLTAKAWINGTLCCRRQSATQSHEPTLSKGWICPLVTTNCKRSLMHIQISSQPGDMTKHESNIIPFIGAYLGYRDNAEISFVLLIGTKLPIKEMAKLWNHILKKYDLLMIFFIYALPWNFDMSSSECHTKNPVNIHSCHGDDVANISK